MKPRASSSSHRRTRASRGTPHPLPPRQAADADRRWLLPRPPRRSPGRPEAAPRPTPASHACGRWVRARRGAPTGHHPTRPRATQPPPLAPSAAAARGGGHRRQPSCCLAWPCASAQVRELPPVLPALLLSRRRAQPSPEEDGGEGLCVAHRRLAAKPDGRTDRPLHSTPRVVAMHERGLCCCCPQTGAIRRRIQPCQNQNALIPRPVPARLGISGCLLGGSVVLLAEHTAMVHVVSLAQTNPA